MSLVAASDLSMGILHFNFAFRVDEQNGIDTKYIIEMPQQPRMFYEDILVEEIKHIRSLTVSYSVSYREPLYNS